MGALAKKACFFMKATTCIPASVIIPNEFDDNMKNLDIYIDIWSGVKALTQFFLAYVLLLLVYVNSWFWIIYLINA